MDELNLEMLSYSKTFSCWQSLGSEWRFGQRLGQVGHLAKTWRVLWPLVDSKGSTNKVVDVSAIAHEHWVAEAVDQKTPSITVILIENEAPVSLTANLTGKLCVYTDSCV